MAQHRLKAVRIQVERLANLLGKVLFETQASYPGPLPLAEFDLVYRGYVDSILQGIASPKTTLEVTGSLTVQWSSLTPSGGQTFAQKHGNDIHVQGFYTETATTEIMYTPSVRITRDGSGNITQVQFGDVIAGRIVII